MKKVVSLSMVCLMAFSICAVFSCSKSGSEENVEGETPGSYVDLGLSSGTKWKTSNEANAADVEYAFFTYDEAMAQFGNKIPSREQWMELVNECDWSWTGMGYKVVGPSGKSISLPAAGHCDCAGSVREVGSYGSYWSSTISGSEYACYLYFSMSSVHTNYHNRRCFGQSVRLVQD